MADIKILNNPKFDAITVSESIEILSQNTIVKEFYFKNEFNLPSIKKKGNFEEWEFRIFQSSLTDAEWETLKDNLELLNDDSLIDFYPDTIDNPTIKYKSYMYFEVDEINLDVEFIYAKIQRYYSNENEVL